MSFEIVDAADAATLVLGESVPLEDAEPLHAALLALTRASRRVEVDAARVESVHSGVVQLLLSLRRTSPRASVCRSSEAFASAFTRLGVLPWLPAGRGTP
jgi:ABC-type transporter Mla MlaB component